LLAVEEEVLATIARVELVVQVVQVEEQRVHADIKVQATQQLIQVVEVEVMDIMMEHLVQEVQE
jgi:hypothetical protein